MVNFSLLDIGGQVATGRPGLKVRHNSKEDEAMKGEMKHGNTYHQLIIINLGIIEERLFQSQLYVTTCLGQMVTVHQIVSRNISQDWNEDISKVWEQ